MGARTGDYTDDGATLDVTAAHRLYSATRRAWVAAGQLGTETLQTRDGTVRINRLDRSPQPAQNVYNLEVFGTHRYFVGDQNLLAHNVCGDDMFDRALARGGPTTILGRGSTARLSSGTTLARNLREQLAIDQVISHSTAGRVLGITMTDPRWPASDRWVKMSQRVYSGGREGPIEVHYVRNTITGALDDLKIILPGAR